MFRQDSDAHSMFRNKITWINRNWFFLILLFIFLYLYVFKLPFPGTDDLFFKEAGVSLIRGQGFRAPGLIGFSPDIEKHFVWYPPLYPFIYGIWFFLFGFSISNSLVLSYLICGLIAFRQCQLYDAMAKTKTPFYIYGLISFSWTIALKEIHRPDALLTLFVLSLLLLLIKKITKGLTLSDNLNIIFLIGLSLATSFALGILSMVYIYFVFVSMQGFSIRTTKNFFSLFTFGFAICSLIWWLSFHSAPYLFKTQFIEFLYNRLFPIEYLSILPYTIINHFKFGFSLFYLPLIIFLIFVTIKSIILESDMIKKNLIFWQFLGIVIAWLILVIIVPYRYTYFQVFYTIFISGVVFQISAKLFEKSRIKRFFYLCLFISYLPFFKTTFLLPLTWNKQDMYGYNKRLILSNVSKGSKIITDPRFWYLFDKDYEVFSPSSSYSVIHSCDYVLLASGGGGSPSVPLNQMVQNELSYFKQNFIKHLSSMTNQPNKLFGIPISRSRWSYRFELYKRK